jgi:hypothetical protein
MISGNPSTLKMHMTGMESFNVASKRGPGAIPMNQTTTTGTAVPNDNSSQVMTDSRTISTNKSSMCKLTFKFIVRQLISSA